MRESLISPLNCMSEKILTQPFVLQNKDMKIKGRNGCIAIIGNRI